MLEAALLLVVLGSAGAAAAWVFLRPRPPALPAAEPTPRERIEARLTSARFEPVEGRWQRGELRATRTEAGIELAIPVPRGVEVLVGRPPRVEAPEALAWFDDATRRILEGLQADGGALRDGHLTVPAEALLDDVHVPERMEGIARHLGSLPTREVSEAE